MAASTPFITGGRQAGFVPTRSSRVRFSLRMTSTKERFREKYKSKIITATPARAKSAVIRRSVDGRRLLGSTENLITSSDAYFRPVDPCVAPDGSIYVTDCMTAASAPRYNDPPRPHLPHHAEREKTHRKEKQDHTRMREPSRARQPEPRYAVPRAERLLASGVNALQELHKTLLSTTDRNSRHDYVVNRPNRRPKTQSLSCCLQMTPIPRARRANSQTPRDEYLPNILNLADDPKLDGEVLTEVLLAAGKSTSPKPRRDGAQAYDRTTATIVIARNAGDCSRGARPSVQKIVDRPKCRSRRA